MSQRFELNVEARSTGKHNSRKLRMGRKIPAIVYGATDNKNVTIDEGLILKYHNRAHENALFSLKSTDTKLNNIVVLMKEVTVHPVTRKPEHVDLFALDLKKTVRISVEVKFEGKPLGLAEGGLLNVVNRQIEIECLPTEIPESISVDISNLGVGDALHLSEVTIPQGIKLISPPELTLAVVNILEEEVVATPVVDPAAAAAPGAPAAAGAPAAPGAAPAAGAAAPAAGGKAPAAGKADAKAPAKDKK